MALAPLLGLGPLQRRRWFAAGPSFLLHDTFTDADGTALTAHTMDVGGGWTALGGTADIQGNEAAPVTFASGESWNRAEAGNAEVIVAAICRFEGASFGNGVVARVSDANNLWIFRLAPTQTELYEKNAGSYTLRANTAKTRNLSTNYALSLRCEGTTLTGTVDGGSNTSYGSASFNQTATKHGLYWAGTTADRSNDFEVTAL